MSHTPLGGHPAWDLKLADRASLPPASGEEKARPRHVFTHPYQPKAGMVWREETEGSSASSAHSPASPPYLRWARTLHDLLDDAEGVRVFRKFVSDAGGLHVDRLNFFFAVQGLREESEPAKIRQVVSAIYRFLRKSQLAMPDDLKKTVKQALKDGVDIDKTVFDNMEQQVTRCITETTYQAFLRSDAYVSYVSAATQPLSSPENDAPTTYPKEPLGVAGVGVAGVGAGAALATLHEGEELAAGAGAGGAAPRLTHDALLATQSRRLHSDTLPGSLRKRSVYAPHLSYAGYCPASRQSSSRGSVSSGRADSDAVSLSGSSVDGMSLRGARDAGREARARRLHAGAGERRAYINRDQDAGMMIPRTARVQSEALRVLPPAEFAPLLIERLERVRRDRDNKERLERRLAEGESEDGSLALPPQLVAAAIREKLQVDDGDDQDILDQHVSRVWSERTPGASPPARRAGSGRAGRSAPRRAPSADSGLAASERLTSERHTPRSPRRPRRALTCATDSGVSVVSEAADSARVLLWVAEARRPDHDDRDRASSTDRDEPRRHKHKQRGSGSKSSSTTGSTEAGAAGSAAGGAAGPCTVCVVTFLDESVPYRLRVPAAPLTLLQLKDYLPRKGNYRYFFKTECADLDNTVIQEEVTNDNDILPMFEGKVMARVKSID